MKITAAERQAIEKKKAKNRGGRPIDPGGALALARKHGINRSTLRNRLRAGKTLEEALSAPIKTRKECGELAAKSRWGGTK